MTTVRRLIQVGIDSRGAKQGAREVDESFKRVGKSAKQGRNDLGRFEKKQDEVAVSARRASTAITSLFGGITAGLAIRGTVRLYAEYEDTLAQVALVSRATADETQRLVETSRRLGATTRFTATQAGEGLLFLARAGFSVNEAIEAVPATLNLATAGVLDLGEAADFASNILSQFQLETIETERVVDTLVNTANSANTDVRQLAEAMKFAGPVAGALGLSVENTAAAIGALGDSGIQASLAGTNLRGILAQLLQPSTEGARAIKRLTGDLDSLDPTVNDLTDIFGKLEAAGFGASDAVQIFGRRNAAAALVLANSVEKINELTQANEAAKGIAEEYAEVLSGTLIGRTKALVSAVQELALQIGETSSGMSVFVDFLTDVARYLGGTVEEGEQVTLTVRAVAVSLKLLTLVGAGFLALKLAGYFYSLGRAVLFTNLSMKSLTKTSTVLLGILTAIGSFKLGTSLYNEYRQLQEDVIGVVTTLGEVAVKFGFFTKRVFTELASDILNIIVNLGVDALDGLQNIFAGTEALFNRLGLTIGGDFFNSRIKELKRFGREVQVAAQANADAVKETEAAAIQGLRDLYQAELERIRRDFEEGGTEAEKGFAEKFIDSLEADVNGMLDALLPETKSLSEQLAELAGRSEEALSVGDDQVQGLKDYAKAMQDTAEAARELERINAIGRLEEQIDALRAETELLELGETARENRVRLLKFEGEAVALLGLESDEAAAKIKLFEEELQRLTEARELRQVADEIGDAFGDNFEDIIFDAKSVGEALRELGREASRIAFRQFVTAQLSGAVAGGIQGAFGLGSRTGNILDRGSYVAFANGGIVDRPTTFPMSGGRTGIMGEGGKPEAIVPLPDGRRIPVEMRGGDTTTTVNAPVTIQTPDIGSFGRSQHQLSREITRMHRRAG